MKQNIRILAKIACFLLLPLLFAAKCKKDSEFCHTKIPLLNASDRDIYIEWGRNYPDTTEYKHQGVVSYISNEYMFKSQKGTLNVSTLRPSIHARECWEDVFLKWARMLPADTLSVYILDAHQMENAPQVNGIIAWTDDMFLQRYDLSLEDLQKLDFQLQYPPSEAMRNMKMYPPYNEQ